MAHFGDFFLTSAPSFSLSAEDYKKADLVVKAFTSIAKSIYQSVYIIDYYKKNFLYVSDNSLFLCAHSAEEVKELGYTFYINHIPLVEQRRLVEISKSISDFFKKVPREEQTDYTIFYEFHIVIGKEKKLINHKLNPLLLTKEGHIWLATCSVSLSSHTTPGHVEIHKSGVIPYWTYSLVKHGWEKNQGFILNKRERTILSLSIQGYTMNEIGNQLCLALDTIKSCKRNLFEKMNVKNIAEAISFAITHKLL